MSIKIAIQPDYFDFNDGPQSFSNYWIKFLNEQSDFEPHIVNLYKDNPTESLAGCSAFMWRRMQHHAKLARRIIPVLEASYNIPCFPSTTYNSLTLCKIEQYFRLSTAKLPIPNTWAFFKEEDALEYLEQAHFPLVVKLPMSRGSSGVALLKNLNEAQACTRQLFGNGVRGLWQALGDPSRFWLRRLRESLAMAWGENICQERHVNEILFQEFLPNNDFDTRVTVIGRYATAFRRKNREGDFRASGGGLMEFEPNAIDPNLIALAFKVTYNLNAPFLAIDFLYKDKNPMICEVNFAYSASVVRRCPGFWFIKNESEFESFNWHNGGINPELLTLQEFLRIYNLNNLISHHLHYPN